MKKIELVKTPGIRPGTAFRILAEGENSLHPKTTLKLLAERMRHQMQEAAKQSATTAGVIDFADYRKSRTMAIGRNGTSQMIPPSGKDNYGEYAPLARREMI